MKIDPTKSITQLDSREKWAKTTIMAWIHWNEIAGVLVLKDLLRRIKPTKWVINFIFWNLKAIEQNVRETEKNMNRSFIKNNKGETYEDLRAREIIKILKESDYLLDLHSSTSKESQPFLISEYKDLWKLFPVKIISSWFDILHPGWSDWYMNSIGKVWLCLESGSIDDNNTGILKKSVINFLKYTWNINWDPEIFNPENQKYINFDYIYKNKSDKFVLDKDFWDFQFIKKWEIIWYDWKEVIRSPKDWVIVFAHNKNKKNQECFLIWEYI